MIGAVGRLESEKRFDLLLNAFAQIHNRYPHTMLAIIGEGSLRPDLEASIRAAGLGSSVRLLGHRTDIIALHHAFDLFVQSSEREGTPNAVLEAMAMETPLVATDVGGTGELITNTVDGLLVPRQRPGRAAPGARTPARGPRRGQDASHCRASPYRNGVLVRAADAPRRGDLRGTGEFVELCHAACEW